MHFSSTSSSSSSFLFNSHSWHYAYTWDIEYSASTFRQCKRMYMYTFDKYQCCRKKVWMDSGKKTAIDERRKKWAMKIEEWRIWKLIAQLFTFHSREAKCMTLCKCAFIERKKTSHSCSMLPTPAPILLYPYIWSNMKYQLECLFPFGISNDSFSELNVARNIFSCKYWMA